MVGLTQEAPSLEVDLRSVSLDLGQIWFRVFTGCA